MKRFYKEASSQEVGDGYTVCLDGKPVRTQAGTTLTAPEKSIADMIVKEWNDQKDVIDPSLMPMTQIVTTTCDHVAQVRPVVTQEVMRYLNTDLIFYRADDQVPLAARQQQAWDKWVSWFAVRSNSRLATTTTLAALSQPQSAHDELRNSIDGLSLWRFSVLQIVTAMTGSVILALAFVEGDASVEDLEHAMYVEETYRGEIYNEALHGAAPQQERAIAANRRDLAALAHILKVMN